MPLNCRTLLNDRACTLLFETIRKLRLIDNFLNPYQTNVIAVALGSQLRM